MSFFVFVYHFVYFFEKTCLGLFFFSWAILILTNIFCCGDPLLCLAVVWRNIFFKVNYDPSVILSKKDALLKPNKKKTALKHFFKRGSPWATLIHNSMFVLGVHYCVQMLPGVIFFQTIPLPVLLLKIFSLMICLWYYYWISMGFLWDFHDVSVIFLEDIYGISEGMLWEFYGILMGCPLDSYRISMVFLWCFYDISMGFLLDSCGISIGFLWDFHGISMMFLWYFYGITKGILMGFLCVSYAISMLFLCSFYGISVGFLWDSYGVSMIFLWYVYGITMGCQLIVSWNQLKINSN